MRRGRVLLRSAVYHRVFWLVFLSKSFLFNLCTSVPVDISCVYIGIDFPPRREGDMRERKIRSRGVWNRVVKPVHRNTVAQAQ